VPIRYGQLGFLRALSLGVKEIPAVPLLVVLGSGLLGGVAASGGPNTAITSSRYEKYDEYFRKYTKLYFDDRGENVPWQLLKAQAIVESNLQPNVVSSEHSTGLMQLMPATYEDVRQQMRQENKKLGRAKNPELGDIKDPESNIRAGIWYDHVQFEIWKPKSDKQYHRHFMLASYNAGSRTLQRAQELAQTLKMNERKWPTIVKVAPKVKDWRSRETIAYVDSVLQDLKSLDKNGRVVGPVISKVDDAGRFAKDVGGFLLDQLKRFTHIPNPFHRRRETEPQ
jgi:hypothetical protein